MKTCLQRVNNALIFSDAVRSAPGSITFYGTPSKLMAASREWNRRGWRSGWIARATVLILGPVQPSSEQREQARQIVRRLHHYHHQFVVGDRHGLDGAIVGECNRLGADYQTFGLTVRPANGGRRYTRIVVEPGLCTARKNLARRNWLLSAADIVYLIGVEVEPGLLRGKDVVRVP